MLQSSHPAWAAFWPAPAKLNLLLHVVGQRDDGYHLLETVFQLLEHGDLLRFSPRDDGRVVRVGGLIHLAEDDDLVVMAAKHLFSNANCDCGVTIELAKRLPAGGGLGGGSSDAATVLVVLNQLYDLGLSVDELADLGLELGADVPLFVRGFSAWAEGVGENLTRIDLPRQWFLVATPPVAITTADIFKDSGLCRDTLPSNPADLDFAERNLPGRNDCQVIAERHFPEVTELIRIMSAHAPTRMTGTGSSVFSVHSTKAGANKSAAMLPKAVQKFVSVGVNQSVLQNKLEKLFSSK
ncbi:MAG: 4-diphosphocytidyl-2-C-methyl-D-erythritol kinase [Gammaproteobacteria bacterium]|jgi:4-diphosphocytidyl-2-C-methyl-D-erythritol kinase